MFSTMQKVLLFFMLSCGAFYTACAQKTPPPAVVTSFQERFPQIQNPEWEKEKNGDWEAEFEKGNVEMSANFSIDGKWLETETEITFAELPSSVQMALKGKKVKEAAKIQRADGSTVYEAEVGRKDLLFDASGKML
jgi:outer membrane biogenesis lipoprotein LolB